MFEDDLKQKFKEIFGVDKVSYSEPSESGEQLCLFIEVEDAFYSFRDKKEIARVTGNAVIIAPNEKIPFGFLSKRIAQAKPELKNDFFFFDFEDNTKRYQNLVERRFSFIYFFTGQYDPNLGTINQVNITTEGEA